MGRLGQDVLALILAESMALALLGVLLGLAGAYADTRVLSSLLFEVRSTDPLTFAAVTILLCSVALLASYVPAHRAMRVDPMAALRCE